VIGLLLLLLGIPVCGWQRREQLNVSAAARDIAKTTAGSGVR
jgi:hypothetical protein